MWLLQLQLPVGHSAGAVVATGSSIIANFDRLGVQLTLTGQRNAGNFQPASDGYRDGELDGLVMLVESGTGGSLQIGPDNKAVDRFEVSIGDMRATGPKLNLSGVSVSTLESARSVITTIDLAITTVAAQRGDRAQGGAELAGYQVQQRTLPRSVGAQQPVGPLGQR